MKRSEYRKYIQRLEGYSDHIKDLYIAAIDDLLKLYNRIDFNPDKPFEFSHYKNISKEQGEIMRQLHSRLYNSIKGGMTKEWEITNNRVNKTVVSLLKSHISTNEMKPYLNTDSKPLDEYFSRVGKDGLKLSERVWTNIAQFKEEVEMTVDLALREGHSAGKLGKDMKKYLKDPDKLFRRVRDQHGELHLSKRAKAYKPGQGVYRSSYKNTMRLAVTHINMSHHETEWDRWQNMPFVVGYEVRRSDENPYECDVCDKLKGLFPKIFKFVGWHPWCRCLMIAIMMSPDEIKRYLQWRREGKDLSQFKSKNEVTELHDNAKEWIRENSEKILSRKSLPYFIRDNFKVDKEKLVFTHETKKPTS